MAEEQDQAQQDAAAPSEPDAAEQARRERIAARVLPEGASQEDADRLEQEMARRHETSLRLSAQAAEAGDSFEAQMALQKAAKAADSGIPEPFTRGAWGDHVNYVCRFENCLDATLDEKKAWLHYVGKHQRQEAARARNPFLNR